MKIVSFIEKTVFTCYNLLHTFEERKKPMRNYKFYSAKDGRMPMTMPDPADFGDSKQDAIMLYHTADGAPVIVCRSVALTPMPWRVQCGTSTVFFCTYREATDYCRRRGYKLIEKGGSR